ncbi:hypothetical protein BDY21DRAFT_367489 [Lineolata rhizophorae]|uniref:Uncharacterized protein n=1 Tax=Lineolata rhizophorae TaxID=578093 RepID=A0A6A6NMB0_9PEZI|nr:hypothetical protein BDY21DRAFT_367489 [Lineolata rhizophorae]
MVFGTAAIGEDKGRPVGRPFALPSPADIGIRFLYVPAKTGKWRTGLLAVFPDAVAAGTMASVRRPERPWAPSDGASSTESLGHCGSPWREAPLSVSPHVPVSPLRSRERVAFAVALGRVWDLRAASFSTCLLLPSYGQVLSGGMNNVAWGEKGENGQCHMEGAANHNGPAPRPSTEVQAYPTRRQLEVARPHVLQLRPSQRSAAPAGCRAPDLAPPARPFIPRTPKPDVLLPSLLPFLLRLSTPVRLSAVRLLPRLLCS